MSSIPQYLYHGTSVKHLENILSNGIKPRGDNPSNWSSCESHPGAVYLTDAFASYYAHAACEDNEDLLVLKIDTSKLDIDLFFADEDAVEQIMRGNDEIGHLSVVDRTLHYRNELLLYNAETSLKILGNCTYIDTIPPEAIVDYKVLDNRNYSRAVMSGIDPTITIMCYRILGSKYRDFTKSLFDGNNTFILSEEIYNSIFKKVTTV